MTKMVTFACRGLILVTRARMIPPTGGRILVDDDDDDEEDEGESSNPGRMTDIVGSDIVGSG